MEKGCRETTIYTRIKSYIYIRNKLYKNTRITSETTEVKNLKVDVMVNLKSSRKKVMRIKDLLCENKQKQKQKQVDQFRNLLIDSCEETLWKYFRENSTCDIKY